MDGSHSASQTSLPSVGNGHIRSSSSDLTPDNASVEKNELKPSTLNSLSPKSSPTLSRGNLSLTGSVNGKKVEPDSATPNARRNATFGLDSNENDSDTMKMLQEHNTEMAIIDVTQQPLEEEVH